jgi:hypothetical protein
MQSEQDINFANPKKKFSPEEFEEIKKQITEAL